MQALQSRQFSHSSYLHSLDLVINRESVKLHYYTLMKGGGASAILSKKIKATIQETFVARVGR
jgi:hypothetical protein